MEIPGATLVVNAGSSSLKYKIFRGNVELLAGHVSGIGREGTSTVMVHGVQQSATRFTKDYDDALAYAIEIVKKRLPHENITHVLHRVVHGGEHYTQHTEITEEVERGIEALGKLAPLHNPANLIGIRAAKRAIPSATHIAFFDTAFHHTIPKYAFLYGLPFAFYEQWGIRKYGFHGLSHEYCAIRAYEITKHTERIITCHLGSGSSITAVHNGRSMDTTMGFTPLDGLLMATRAGELDPEIPFFLMREEGLTVKQVEDLLNTGAGLKGLTGTSDLREIKALAEKGDVHARTAIEMLAYRIAMAIGSYHITVGGTHTITFTGGIGENAPWLRTKVCARLAPIGVQLNEAANERNDAVISSPSSRVNVLVIPANEELHMVNLFLAGRYLRA